MRNTLFELLGLRLEKTQRQAPLDPERVERNERHIEAIFHAMCRYIPELLVVDKEHVFNWDEDHTETIDLSDLPDLEHLGPDCLITAQHLRAYKTYQVNTVPANLIYLCLYDLLLEYEYPLTPEIRRLLKETIHTYAPDRTTMDLDLRRIYLSRFQADPEYPVSAAQLEKAREPFVNGVAKKLQTCKSGNLRFSLR